MKNYELSINDLEMVSGGTADESQELVKLIRKIDPNCKIRLEADIVKWLKENFKFELEEIRLSTGDKPNRFTVAGGVVLTNKGLMQLLSLRLPKNA